MTSYLFGHALHLMPLWSNHHHHSKSLIDPSDMLHLISGTSFLHHSDISHLNYSSPLSDLHLNMPVYNLFVIYMLLSLAPLTFRKSATRPWCHSQAGVGLRAVASWLPQRRPNPMPNRTSSLDTRAVAESPQCGSTGCGRPGTTWSRDSFPLRAALVADCCA